MIKNIKKGDLIGPNFKVIDICGGEGKSGMGVVYICIHNETGGIYALKTLQDHHIISDEMNEAFLLEALIWIELEKHPNIVNAYSFDIIEDRSFILMEPILPDDNNRTNLQHYINTEFSPSVKFYEMLIDDSDVKNDGIIQIEMERNSKILDLAIQLCHGMEHLEKRGVRSHRDLKPDNIMITNDGILKITDFGFAITENELNNKSITESKVDENVLDSSEDKIKRYYTGTYEYMAPETFDGLVNFKSDIYSIGVILYQMINGGIPPFDADGYDGWCITHKNGEVKPIDNIIFPIIEKCLKKNPDDRYDNFVELREDLERLYQKETGNIPTKFHPIEELTAEEHVNKAYALSKLGFHEKSISELEVVLALNPNLIEAHMNLGMEFIITKEYELAINKFKEVIKIDPDNSIAYYNLATLSSMHMDLHNKNFNEVIDFYKEIIKINPQYIEAYVNMGKTLMDAGQVDEAILQFKNALNINPDFFEGIMNLGQAYLKKGYLDEAIILYEKAYHIKPEDPGLYNSWGIALSDNEDNEGAIKKYIKALTLKSDDSKVHNNFGLVFSELGKIDLAIHEFEESIKSNPENAGTYLSWGIILAKSGDYDEAINKFENALKIKPNLKGLNSSLSKCLLEKKEYLKLISRFKDFNDPSFENEEMFINLGIAYCKIGEYAKGRAVFEMILNSYSLAHDNLSIVRMNYGQVLLDQEDYVTARDQYIEILKFDPNNVAAHDNLGVVYYHLNLFEEAIHQFEEAIRIDPMNENAKINLERTKDFLSP